MPDFEIFWGEWGHIELKHELDRSSGTFFFVWGFVKARCDFDCMFVENTPLEHFDCMFVFVENTPLGHFDCMFVENTL